MDINDSKVFPKESTEDVRGGFRDEAQVEEVPKDRSIYKMETRESIREMSMVLKCRPEGQ